MVIAIVTYSQHVQQRRVSGLFIDWHQHMLVGLTLCDIETLIHPNSSLAENVRM